MIKGVKKGIYIIGDGSFSIDQQRYNFQFGGQLYYEIKDGKIVGMLKDVAYQSNTQDSGIHVSISATSRTIVLADRSSTEKASLHKAAQYRTESSTRFNGVNVINTSRKI